VGGRKPDAEFGISEVCGSGWGLSWAVDRADAFGSALSFAADTMEGVDMISNTGSIRRAQLFARRVTVVNSLPFQAMKATTMRSTSCDFPPPTCCAVPLDVRRVACLEPPQSFCTGNARLAHPSARFDPVLNCYYDPKK
jgi:hypothetical protein